MRHLATYDDRDSTPTLIIAGMIRTVDDAAPTASAMLIGGGRILFVGTKPDAEAVAADLRLDPVRIDCPQATIVPGFVDPHAHPLMYGQLLSWIDVSPDKASTIPEMIEILRRESAKLQEGGRRSAVSVTNSATSPNSATRAGTNSTRWPTTEKSTS